MIVRKTLLVVIAGLFTSLSLNAQLFETRSTRYTGELILTQFQKLGSEEQHQLRDSVINFRSKSLQANDIIETYFDDYHVGLVIFRNGRPFELIGFWNPGGNSVDGGTLINGAGKVKTPFNPNLIVNFKSESVVYVDGSKNGQAFYYCDCASVLRKGTFKGNEKTGLWKEFDASGAFIKQKRIKVVNDTIATDGILKDKDYLLPANCMMRNPDEKLKCPNPIGG